jgi:hypothetical protein
MLTPYSFRKQVAHVLKSTTIGHFCEIDTQPPDVYAERFRNHLKSKFLAQNLDRQWQLFRRSHQLLASPANKKDQSKPQLQAALSAAAGPSGAAAAGPSGADAASPKFSPYLCPSTPASEAAGGSFVLAGLSFGGTSFVL